MVRETPWKAPGKVTDGGWIFPLTDRRKGSIRRLRSPMGAEAAGFAGWKSGAAMGNV
jgi:hypothetical protein